MYNVIIGGLRFSWDPQKDLINRRKHGVDFEEAASVFSNVLLGVYFDDEHSRWNEERYLAVGISSVGNFLVVVHLESRSGKVIRLISARRATDLEIKQIIGG